MEKYEVISEEGLVGSSVQRLDTLWKTTGRTVYTRDMKLPRVLHVVVRRCPFPHARITTIDASEALRTLGVRLVLTGQDFPPTFNENTPPLARDEVLYSNQAVVAVAAESVDAALLASKKVEIEYEQLPAVLDPELAMSEEAKVVIRHPGESREGRNIARHIRAASGDVDSGFGQAEYIIENTYTTAGESCFQLEPLTFLAQPDSDGGVTLWTTSSGPHKMRWELSQYLGIDPYKIRVRVPSLGGWFGSKEESHVAAICAQAALRSSRPARLALSREETITAAGIRHPSKIRIKDGVSKDGKIVARKIVGIFDGGAYSSVGNACLRNGLFCLALYKIPNLEMDLYRVHTNRVPGTPKRGPIITQMVWALESQMDFIASKLRIDPIELRLRNLLRNGDASPIGEIMDSISHDTCLLAVAKSVEWSKRIPPRGHLRFGKGIAMGVKGGFTDSPAQAMVVVRATGKIEVTADLVENGQGILTTIAQIVATEFGVPIEDAVMVPLSYGSDSVMSGFSGGASASRQLVTVGKAVLLACRDAKTNIANSAAPLLNVPPAQIDVQGGKVFSKSLPEKSMRLADLFKDVYIVGRTKGRMPIGGRDFVGFGTVEHSSEADPDKGVYKRGHKTFSPYYVNLAEAAEVCVNVETGQVGVMRIVTAMDVGKAINPAIVKGQIVGSVMMGVNATLGEELVLKDGRIVNANLADYKLLSALDAPMIEPIIIETPFEDGPFGAKPAGEAALLSTAPAIRNAIYDAVGVWVNDLPITAERVLEALDSSNSKLQSKAHVSERSASL